MLFNTGTRAGRVLYTEMTVHILRKIIDAGFDGVYLDIIDGFENFE